VWFDSGDTACAASFYRPQLAGAPVPCVVMAHGTAGTKDLGLAAYAEGFVGAGLAVLLFDYRHFGASAGQPRQLIDIARQLDDYRAAVRFARTCEGVDPTRIALWGTSLSGGHVLAVAASDPQIAAVVSQVPFAGVEFGRASPRSRVATLRLVAAAAWDSLRGLLGFRPYLIPLVSPPGAVGAFNDAEARSVLQKLSAAAPTWRNAFAARAIFSLLRYRPGELAERLTMPLLVCVAEGDTAGSVALAIRAANRAPHGELRLYPVNHFAVYVGDVMQQLIADETAFFRAHLFGDRQRERRVGP
jgi:dienelactone hydrolase